jgi:hypothetical protein
VVTLVFELLHGQTEWGESIGVVGDSGELGAWRPERGAYLATGPSSYPLWRGSEVQVEVGAEPVVVRYKYFRDRRVMGEGFAWEEQVADRKVCFSAAPSHGSVWMVTDSAFDADGPQRLTQLAASPSAGLAAGPAVPVASFSEKYALLGSSPLGLGGFSTVWRCRPRDGEAGGIPLAVKRIEAKQLPGRARRLLFGGRGIRGEIALHQRLRHERIVGLHEVFEDAGVVSLVMEWCQGGDLLDLVLHQHRESGSGLPEPAAAAAARQLLEALSYLHGQDIIHRDVKCENFFRVEARGKVPLDMATYKLGDFGLATRMLPDQVLLEHVGSPSTSAPEIVLGRPYSKPADIWSAGTVAFTALSVRRPFEAPTSPQILEQIRRSKGQVLLHGAPWEAASAGALSFIGSLLQTNALWRPTASAALEHSWLQQ